MESNRDEALRALAIAQKHRDSANYDSARRFVEKSLKLFETPEAKKLLDIIDSEAANAAGSSSFSSSTEAHPSASGTKHRHQSPPSMPSNGKGKSVEDDAKPREYSAENVAVVKRVRACRVTEYYEILALKRDCEESDIKKSYRKVRLVALHRSGKGSLNNH
jgi:DnaJ homolog subfamily B member 12